LKAISDGSEVPRVVIGAEKLVVYDWLNGSKPIHRRVAWRDGIWAAIQEHLPDCRSRHCLLLLSIDPVNKHQTFQHGDPGPSIQVDPQRAGFAQVKDWLQKLHEREDMGDLPQLVPTSVLATGPATLRPAQAKARPLGKLLGRLKRSA